MFNQHVQTLLLYGGMSTSPTGGDYEADYGTPDYTITSFPSDGTGVASGANDVLIAIDSNISATNDGVLIEMGGSGGSGLAVGVNNGTLRARAFDSAGDSAWGTDPDAAEVEADISSYTGSDATYYIVVDASAFTLTVYVQAGGKGSASAIVELGTDTAGGGQSQVYGSNGKGYGQVNGNIADITSDYEVSFNGTIDEIRYWAEDAGLDVSGFPPTPTPTPVYSAGFAIPSGTGTPSYVGATSTSSYASTLSLTDITGLQENDIVLVLCSSDSGTASQAITSSGWTTVVGPVTNNSITNTVGYKVMGATPDTSISLGEIANISAIAFRNAQYDSLGGFATASSTTIDPPSITVTEDNSVSILCAMIDDDATTISSPSTGYTVATETSSSGFFASSQALMYKTGVSSGTEDPGSYTWNSSDALVNRTVILKPAATIRNAAGFQIPA